MGRTAIQRLTVTVFLLAALVLTPRVNAHEDACIGSGSLSLEDGLGTNLHDPKTTTFTLTTAVAGGCVLNSQFLASGTITGWCRLAHGTGTTDDGHGFFIGIQGEVLTFSGDVTGGSLIHESPITIGSCAGGNEREFILSTLVVAKVHAVGGFPPPAKTVCDFVLNCD